MISNIGKIRPYSYSIYEKDVITYRSTQYFVRLSPKSRVYRAALTPCPIGDEAGVFDLLSPWHFWQPRARETRLRVERNIMLSSFECQKAPAIAASVLINTRLPKNITYHACNQTTFPFILSLIRARFLLH